MDDVKVVMVDCSIKYSYLAQGNADVAGSYGTAGEALLKAVGFKDIGKFNYADAGINLPSHGIVASTSTIQNKPDKVRRFVAATAKAWQDARSHPDDAVAALVAANPLDKGKEAQVKATLLASFQYIETPGTMGKPFGWQSPEEWKKAVDASGRGDRHEAAGVGGRILHQRIHREMTFGPGRGRRAARIPEPGSLRTVTSLSRTSPRRTARATRRSRRSKA